jgi:predicted ester cyclase
LIEEWNLAAIEKFFSPEFIAHGTVRDMTGGPEAIRSFLKSLHRAFPRLHVEVEILVEAEDRVAWQRRLEGIQKGKFMGFPATGKEIIWRDVITSRVENGLIAEDWSITDIVERLLLARK